MKYDITKDGGIQALAEHFRYHGHEIRLVGGAVRDIIVGQVPKDFDFCTTANPTEMMNMIDGAWKVIPTGIDHGTVTFMSLWGSFEVTTLRKDVECDGRHAIVEFTSDWMIDAARRDFTVNAMSMDMEGNLYDYFSGQSDLKAGRIKFVGNPEARIKEDALRMIRFLRFEARFGGNSKYDESYFACIHNQHLIQKVSPERVWQEVKSAARSPETFRNFMSYMVTGAWFTQFGIVLNHVKDNNIHNIKEFVSAFPTFGVAVFIPKGQSDNFAQIFRLSTVEKNELHFFSNMKDSALTSDWVEEMIANGFDKQWLLSVAIFQGKKDIAEHIKQFEKPIFPVSGKDLIAAGVKPGPEMGYILEMLRHDWLLSRFTKSKEELMNSNWEGIKNAKQN